MRRTGIVTIGRTSPRYPALLLSAPGNQAPRCLSALGNADLLERVKLGLLCSIRCPGNTILATYDMMEKLSPEGPVLIGGFHSPMERKCFEVLLRRKIPVIYCPARAIDTMRERSAWKEPLAEGRLLVLSRFAPGNRRPTKALARMRNVFVAALADALLVPHASPRGATENCVRQFLLWRRPAFSFPGESGLRSLGVRIVESPRQFESERWHKWRDT